VEEKVTVTSPVLNRYYEDFLALRKLLNKIDMGEWKNDPQGYIELLQHVMNFSDALYSTLLDTPYDENTRKAIRNALAWLDLYRENKQRFAEEADGTYVSYLASYKLPGDSRPRVLRVYSSWAEFQEDRKNLENQDMQLVTLKVVPSLKLLRYLARMIVIRALDLGIFGFKIEKKPSFWLRGENNV